MAAIVSTIDIARTPADVYAYVTDPARFAEWQPDVVAARADDGARFTTTRRIGRFDRTYTQDVTENDPPRRWSVRGVDGPLRPAMTVTIEPLDGGAASRVTFALDFEGRGFADLLVPMIRRMAAKGSMESYRNLKRRLEAVTPGR
jgi:uncharacterized protein YndB with AHSA1/START domain